ncbi:unnamed protein product (macronuclear) [Paramecium tetraurelia]|uniref:Uncharacterized protein n=1 Tax=Paramecium tetraurelia TaxID=5888 RepID=A0E3R6_PARTE|nr:uncharacterized protein GSPATT00023106001 [Paramecium tetraurelia]CAK89933.1 unnamed protein product [Paramecium tetraurelia]|eukprot:XP_001457330.1 hypothetical protein (macronuclear) [Paramecium tetraurelia strain d4-2]
MSNRNTKSKSPNLKKPQNFDKDLMKYLILQKITKPSAPVEMLTKTQPDEDSEVDDFKQEIEIKYSITSKPISRFKKCKINHSFKFPKDSYESSSDNSLQSLKDVTLYELNQDNIQHLTDATQPQFIKLLNERLIKLTDQIQEDLSIQKPNPNPKSSRLISQQISRLQKVRGQNLSNSSLSKQIDQTVASQGRESVTNKQNQNLGFRATPTLSSEKKNQSKHIQQILKIVQQKQLNNNIKQLKFDKPSDAFYKRTLQGNSSYINKNASANDKRNIENIRIKTEYDDQDGNLTQFHILPKSRTKNRESSTKLKKQDTSQNHKILNYTIDSHILEQLRGTRNAKSQNKNYKN